MKWIPLPKLLSGSRSVQEFGSSFAFTSLDPGERQNSHLTSVKMHPLKPISLLLWNFMAFKKWDFFKKGGACAPCAPLVLTRMIIVATLISGWIGQLGRWAERYGGLYKPQYHIAHRSALPTHQFTLILKSRIKCSLKLAIYRRGGGLPGTWAQFGV